MSVSSRESKAMLDFLYIAMGLLFFVVAIAYVFACEKLRNVTHDE